VKPAAALLDVAERIGGAATASAAWIPALQGIADLLAADHAMIVVHETASGRPLVVKSAGMDETDLGRFTSPEAARWMEPFKQAMPDGTAVTWSELVSDRQFERSAFYNEVVRPAKGFYAVATRQNLEAISIFLAVCRSKRKRDFTPGDRVSLQTVLPLFATGLELQRRLQVSERHCSGLLRVLDRLDTGIVLLDAAMRPIFANARIQAIAATKDGLTLDQDGLAAAGPLETQALRNAVAAAIQGAPASPAVAMKTGAMTRLRLSRPSLQPPLMVNVTPIPAGWPTPAAAMVFVVEPEARPAIDAALLSVAFGLAPREAELAALLAQGAKLSDAAVTLGIGVGTARWYLKRVLEKTNTHRQAELVYLILHGFGSRGV
jgi:DNA-binding CsgD family transcriptional regulator